MVDPCKRCGAEAIIRDRNFHPAHPFPNQRPRPPTFLRGFPQNNQMQQQVQPLQQQQPPLQQQPPQQQQSLGSSDQVLAQLSHLTQVLTSQQQQQQPVFPNLGFTPILGNTQQSSHPFQQQQPHHRHSSKSRPGRFNRKRSDSDNDSDAASSSHSRSSSPDERILKQKKYVVKKDEQAPTKKDHAAQQPSLIKKYAERKKARVEEIPSNKTEPPCMDASGQPLSTSEGVGGVFE